MLIEQNYEPLSERDDYSLDLVLNLPKKVINKGIYIYTLELKFIEPTYVHIAYISRVKEILVEAKINLNNRVDEHLERLYDFFEEQGIISVNIDKECTYGNNRELTYAGSDDSSC